MRDASTSAAALSIEATMRILPGAIVIARSRASSASASQAISSARRTCGATMPSRPARTMASRSASPASLSARWIRTKRSGPPCEGRASATATARLASSFDASGTPSSRSRIATSSALGPNSASPSARATIRSRFAGTNMSDRIGRGASDEPAAVAQRLGRDEDPLGVPAVDDLAKALALGADEIGCRHFELVDEELGGVMVEHRLDRTHHDPLLLDRAFQVHEEDGEALRLVCELVVRRRARQKQQQVGVLRARDEDLRSVHGIAVTASGRHRLDARRLRAGLGL